MLARCVDIRMPQHIRNQINVSRFPVEIGAECAAQFMGTDLFFQGRRYFGVFLDHVFNGTLRDPAPLDGEEKGVFVAGRASIWRRSSR